MTGIEITNVLIGMLIAIIGFIGAKMYSKLEQFEKTIQDILIQDISHQKDIERLAETSKDHESRITRLEDEK